MKPTETTYQLAISSKDYKDCHKLREAEGDPDYASPLSFPTVMAKRNGELIGFFGTVPDDKKVIAGPLVIKGSRNPFVAIRLMEAYDVVMNLNGIQLYYFYVSKDRTDALSIKRLEDMGMKYWETVDDLAWFKKELTNGRQDNDSSASTI